MLKANWHLQLTQVYYPLFLSFGAIYGAPLGRYVFSVICVMYILQIPFRWYQAKIACSIFYSETLKHFIKMIDNYKEIAGYHEKEHSILKSMKILIFGDCVCFFVSVMVDEMPYWTIFMYIGFLFVLLGFKLSLKYEWFGHYNTQYSVDHNILHILNIPSLSMYSEKIDNSFRLVSCPQDEEQRPYAGALCDRSACLYLVNDKVAIPMCYDTEQRDAVIKDIREQCSRSDLAVINITENTMPKAMASGLLIQRGLLLWFGFALLLWYVYRALHANMVTTAFLLPLMSFLCCWGVLELYSMKLRKLGHGCLKEAAGLS